MTVTAGEALAGENGRAPSSRLGFVLAASAALTALADFLFYHQPVGFTAALFTIAFFLAAAAHRPARLAGRAGKLLFVLLLGLGLSFAETPGPLALALIALLLPAFLLQGSSAARRLMERAFLVSILPIAALLACGADFNGLRRMGKALFSLRALLNVLVPLAFGGVFLFLFIQANPVFERYAAAIEPDWRLDPLRAMFWVMAFALLWGLFRLHRSPMIPAIQAKPPALQNAGPSSGLPAMLFSPVIVFRSLLLFNALFFLQNGMDAVFLWSGKTLPEDLSYAEYAHRGAYPLIATALLAGAFVLVVLGSAGERPQRPTLVLLVLWLAQNVFLVASAIARTSVYVAEYSLTYLRLFALIWMALVAWGLILIAVRMLLNRSSAWLVKVNAASVLAVLYISCFADYGAVIASYNVAHSFELTGEGTPLDRAYLVEIGPSALWAVQNYLEKPPGFERLSRRPEAEQQAALNMWNVTLTILYRDLRKNQDEWRAWTWRKHRLRQLAVKPDSGVAAQASPQP